VTVNFPVVAGVQTGSSVRYRGVTVGRILDIKPGSSGVDVRISVSPADLVIPADAMATIDQSGLLGENVLNLTPKSETIPAVASKALDSGCDQGMILCNGSRLKGDLGISTDGLIRASIKFAELYGQPEFYNNLNQLTANSGKAAAEIATMSREFGVLARSFRSQIGTLSTNADRIGIAAERAGMTAGEAGAVVTKAGVTLDQVNGLLIENRTTLVSTLDNISQTSETLKVSVNQLPATIDRFQRSRLLTDLETLSANAAVASKNLKEASTAFNNPATLTSLQQTLDAARATFQNAQKITADLDEITGDPETRKQFKGVIKGFSGLLTSSQDLQQRATYAQYLAPAAQQLEMQQAIQAANSINQSPVESAVLPAPIAPALPTQPTMVMERILPPQLSARPQPSVTQPSVIQPPIQPYVQPHVQPHVQQP
jgi:phospholipid/cholesterol/gamma-HCH transport system substrate-binding protein